MSTHSAPPVAPATDPRRVVTYILVGVLIGLTQGLGQGFVTANIPQMAGELGVSQADAAWLMAAYMIPRASLPLMLSRLRAHYGLGSFTALSLVLYLLVSFGAIFATDFRSAMVLQFLSGCASAPLSTLTFLYMLETLPQRLKMGLGLPLALAMIMAAPGFARVIAPGLLELGSFHAVHLFMLGLACFGVLLTRLFPLAEQPTSNVLEPLDFVNFALIAAGFGGIAVVATLGPIVWWFEAPWMGWLLAGSIVSLALAVMSELNRRNPLVDFRWIMSPAMLQMTGAMFLFRLLLTGQSSGMPQLLRLLGQGPEPIGVLFGWVSLAILLAPIACLLFMRPGKEPILHGVALALIAAASFADSFVTPYVRAEDLWLTQCVLGFAGLLFMGPAMLMGLLSALRKGPQYLLSFIIIFLSSQSLGAVIGAGIFTTLATRRQALHYASLTEGLSAADPLVQGRIALEVTRLGAISADPAALKLQAVAALAQDAALQAWVLAYADVFRLTGWTALAALSILVLHLIYNRLAGIKPPPLPGAAPAPSPSAPKAQS